MSESTMTATPAPAWDYVWFGGQPLAQIEVATGAVRTYFNDHLGTPILQTDAAGTVVWRIEHEPYGEDYAFRAGAELHQPLRFPGQEREVGGELAYNVFRWYLGGWGRYSQADPIGFSGGDKNIYRDALGNPFKFIDPLGEDVRICCRPVNSRVLDRFDHCYIETNTNNRRETWGLYNNDGKGVTSPRSCRCLYFCLLPCPLSSVDEDRVAGAVFDDGRPGFHSGRGVNLESNGTCEAEGVEGAQNRVEAERRQSKRFERQQFAARVHEPQLDLGLDTARLDESDVDSLPFLPSDDEDLTRFRCDRDSEIAQRYRLPPRSSRRVVVDPDRADQGSRRYDSQRTGRRSEMRKERAEKILGCERCAGLDGERGAFAAAAQIEKAHRGFDGRRVQQCQLRLPVRLLRPGCGTDDVCVPGVSGSG
jgi:RHS repeat-associated protein